MRRLDRLAVEPDAAAARAVEAGGEPQKRALAAAGAADHGDDLALLHAEVSARERLGAVRVGFVDGFDGEHGGQWRGAKASCQVRKGAATATSRPSVILPSTAKTKIAARICSGLPSCWPSTRR